MKPWPFGALPPDGLEPLGAHTTAYYATGYPYSNSAILSGKDAVLVFDANIFHYAAELKAALDRVRAGRPVYLVLSHSHADHADGTMFFSPPRRHWPATSRDGDSPGGLGRIRPAATRNMSTTILRQRTGTATSGWWCRKAPSHTPR